MLRWLVFVLVLVTHVVSLDFATGPTYYKQGDRVELLVNKVESDNTQLPYRYYGLPFVCPAGKGRKAKPLSLGQIMSGDRIWESDYILEFGVDQPCARLCDLIAKETGLKKANDLIKQGYVVHWLLDGLPGATTFVSTNKNNKYYAAGFPLGFVEDDLAYIYNHVMIVVRYHRDRKNKNKNTIVGFEVYPKSVSNEKCPGASRDYENFAIDLKRTEKGDIAPQRTVIPYTYSVYWREDNSVDYDSRWDLYYENETTKNNKIHWISLINSLVLLGLVSLVVAILLLRLLRLDLQQLAPALPLLAAEEEKNSVSWKNLINEVLVRPALALPLVVLVSSGIQIIVALVGVLLVFAVKSSVRSFSNHQGAVLSMSVFFLVFSGFVSLYSGIVLHKFFNNVLAPYDKKLLRLLLILFGGFLPTLLLSVVLTLNIFVWAKASSYALPFGTILVLIGLVLLVEIPLGLLGGYYGNKSHGLSSLAAPEKGPAFRPVASRGNWLLNPLTSTFVFGLLPFGVVYVELLFIFNSVWLEKTTFYYMYGFLFVTSIMLLIIIGESTIIAIYISLALYNNPNWQWLSFRVGLSIGWFIFAYSVYYFAFYLKIRDFVSTLFYFGYMALVCVVVGIGCGSVGTLTATVFIKRLYGAIKSD